MKKAVIIYSGYNQRAVIAFLRTLTAKKISFGIIASSSGDTIFNTIYAQHVLYTRAEKQLKLADLIDGIEACKNILKADKYVVAPSTEALNRYLLDNRDKFAAAGCDIPLVSNDLYETVSDKYKFGEVCRASGILLPQEYDDINEAPIPFVAKPKKYFTEGGNVYAPFLIHNNADKDGFLSQCNPKDFYFQEFVNGQCLYLLYYLYKDGTVAKLSQINKVQQPGGKSMIAAESTSFHLTSESDKYEKLFKSVGYFGLVMVEVKKDGYKNYMIEANPRFWGPSQLFVDSGVNLFESFLFDNGLLDKKPEFLSITQSIKYFWYGGLVESMRDYGYVAYHDYSKKIFDSEMDAWMAADVYNREDTKDLFAQEVKR
jgi:predicted ATP-grasp superfamily ATP-dependent carboligase